MKVNRTLNRIYVVMDCGARLVLSDGASGASLRFDGPPTGTARVFIYNGETSMRLGFDRIEVVASSIEADMASEGKVSERLEMLANPGDATDKTPDGSKIEIAQVDTHRWAVQDQSGWLAVRRSSAEAKEWLRKLGLLG